MLAVSGKKYNYEHENILEPNKQFSDVSSKVDTFLVAALIAAIAFRCSNALK